MDSRTSLRRCVFAAALACAIGFPARGARCDPAVRSQTEVHPAQRDQGGGGGNPVLQLPQKGSNALPRLRSQGGAGSKAQMHGQNELEIPRVDQMEQKLLGCWVGVTERSPVKWKVLSPAGNYLAYNRDRVHICLTDVHGELHVKYADSEDAAPSEHPYGSLYRPVRALGRQVDMDVKSWDPDSTTSYLATGTARCVLNPDDTITYSNSITTSLAGKPAVEAETRAKLKRER